MHIQKLKSVCLDKVFFPRHPELRILDLQILPEEVNKMRARHHYICDSRWSAAHCIDSKTAPEEKVLN